MTHKTRDITRPIVVTEPSATPFSDTERPLAERINDAARLIGVSRSTLYRMADRGELQMVHIRGRTLILREELERILRKAVASADQKAGQ